jgi:hypothetical protein
MTVMMHAKPVKKKLTCNECGHTGEFVYEDWPGGYGGRVFQNLTVGFSAMISGGDYPIISCACGALIEY